MLRTCYTGAAGSGYAGASVDEIQLPGGGMAPDAWRVVQERAGTLPQVAYTRGLDLSGSLEGAGGIGGLLARSSGYQGASGTYSSHAFYHADGGAT